MLELELMTPSYSVTEEEKSSLTSVTGPDITAASHSTRLLPAMANPSSYAPALNFSRVRLY